MNIIPLKFLTGDDMYIQLWCTKSFPRLPMRNHIYQVLLHTETTSAIACGERTV